ncbi:MAG: alpha/beta hydrolase [Elusimicrobia bacterium]|nr:alpha/beta hydrolase [Elusimicrobiota bacterium]
MAPAAALVLGACTNVFLQPDRVLHDRPERVGAVWEEVRFKSADGTGLTGLWFPARNAASQGVIVHFHGNGENMTSHYLFVYWLALEGYDVFTFDYRGYGASEGKKSLAGAIEDGAAALREARGRAGAAAGRLIVVGQSLGGAVALAALDRDGGEGVRGLVLDSTFASYRAVARDKLGRWWLTWALRYPLAGALISDRWAARRLIARRKPVPLLMLHATGDPVVPYAQGRRLFDLAPGPKEFWTLDSEGHTEALFQRGPEFRSRLLAWLKQLR